MKLLIAAYERQYNRRLHDQGVATALAQHDPQKLDETFTVKQRPEPNGVLRDDKWW